MTDQRSILIVDDDPVHLKLYSWIVNRGGYLAKSALVKTSQVEFPDAETFDLVLMDYNFGGVLSAHEVARDLKTRYPQAPILLLSEQMFMPKDLETIVSGFVRKGDPDALLNKILKMLPS